MKREWFVPLAATALLFAGCRVTSVCPFYTEKDVAFEPALLGDWQKVIDTKIYWKFEKQGENAYRNQARIVAGKEPSFVNPSQADGMTSIPVRSSDSGNTNAPPNLAECAVTAKDGRQFTLFHSTGGKETYELPVYLETSGTAMRLALTPLAVAGDTVMVAGVLAVVGIICRGESHASFTHH